MPELRASARVDLRIEHAPGAEPTVHTLYAKADIERSGAATQAVMRALSDSAAQSGGRLLTPEPLLWQEAAALHWQRALPGRPLEDLDPDVGPRSSAGVGAQLAALHATPVPGLQPIDTGVLRAQVHAAVAMLSNVEAAWQPQLARLAARLGAGGAALDDEPLATLHGDLHPRNILLDGERLAFIDLDGVRAGPAVLELRRLDVRPAVPCHLDRRATPDSALCSGRAFLTGYTKAGGRAVDDALLAWCTAHDLLCKRAYRCVANLKPGRFEIALPLLALADTIAASGRVALPPRGQGRDSREHTPAESTAITP